VQMLFMRISFVYILDEIVTHYTFGSPWVGGISPSLQGAYSVALSGGYDDDVDMGYGL
jgi:hypothetical protein